MRSPTAGLRVSIVLLPGGGADQTVASVRNQTSSSWELIESAPDGSATAANHALARAGGDFVAFVDAGDVLHPHALEWAIEAVQRHTDVDLVYTDEDQPTDDGCIAPFFKPDWSPERLLGGNYFGRLTLIRRELIERVGRARPGSGVAWEYDLVLRASEVARRIEHVTRLGCRRHLTRPAARATADADCAALSDHVRQRGLPARVESSDDDAVYRLRPDLTDEPLVSIVIPAGGSIRRVRGETVDLLASCVESIVARSSYRNFEVVVVADEAVGAGTRARLVAAAGDRLHVVEYREPFNFSRKVNLGVLHAHGDYVLLLNDDTAVLTPDWIESMLVFASDAQIGAVGAVLRFADGRYQHVGVIVLDGDPGHPYYGFPPDYTGYHDNLRVPCNYLAVTAACLLMRRSTFHEVGGLSTVFPSNYNDVDLCLKLGRAGYRIVCTPEAQLYHFESSSRGPSAVADVELERLHNRWATVLTRDPFYSPHFLPNANFLTPLVPRDVTVGAPEPGVGDAEWWWPPT